MFWRIAGALVAAPGPWRVELLRFELRRAHDVERRRWVCSSLLGCVERPARGGGPAAFVANAHVHVWPPRASPASPRSSAGEPWLRAELERFTARGWGVSWDPSSGRFGWVARPLTGDLGPLLAERDFLDGAFGDAAERGQTGPAGRPSMAGALEAFRDGDWIPSALVLARRGLPATEGGATIDLEIRLLGPPAERRRSDRPLRAEASLTLLLPEAARAELPRLRKGAWLRRLLLSARGAGYRARWHIPPQGQIFLQMRAPFAPGLARLRGQQRLLDGLSVGG
jgi:hypothetical protein